MASPLETSKEGAQVALDALFGEAPGLSALIVNGEGMIDLLMEELPRRGKDVPANLSVVVIGWSGLTKHIVPRLTHVDVPALEMASAAVELLARGGSAKLLPAILVEGGTVASNRLPVMRACLTSTSATSRSSTSAERRGRYPQ